MQTIIPALPTEVLLLIARHLGPWDLINLARAIPGMERLYKPRYWLSIKDEEGLGNTVLHVAARNGLIDIIESLLSKGFDLAVRSSQGYTALHHACEVGQYSIASLLPDSGMDPNLLTLSGLRPLHLAVQYRNVRLVRLLLEHEADISVLTARLGGIFHSSLVYL